MPQDFRRELTATLHTAQGGEHLLRRPWRVRLRITDPEGTRDEYADGARLTLGRRAKGRSRNAWEVLDQSVSGIHCELRPRPQGVLLTDLSSKNGTFVELPLVDKSRLFRKSKNPPRVRVHGGVELPVGSTFLLGERSRVEILEVRDSQIAVAETTTFEGIVATSPQMRAVFSLLNRFAVADEFHALVTGETGTGKELVSRAFHSLSSRRSGPFVVLNCGALTPSLVESELFGHAKGAFTGADRDKPGMFERADGGTLFLDEIGELAPDLQVKMLRVVEGGVVRRIGEVHERQVRVRIVAATHRDLIKMINEGEFREDLYYRFTTLVVELPPLRQREGDIEFLAAHFASRRGKRIGAAALERLTRYRWPGNVRELRQVIDRASVLTDGREISGSELMFRAAAAGRGLAERWQRLDRAEALRQFERWLLESYIDECGGDLASANRRAGFRSKNGLRKALDRLEREPESST